MKAPAILYTSGKMWYIIKAVYWSKFKIYSGFKLALNQTMDFLGGTL